MMRYSFEDFVEIISKLRAPDGCPWDREQTHESLKPCMINETVEALAAVDVLRETGDSSNLCEELGDMLLQVVLQSQIAKEEGLFTISDVVQAACEKMLRRHPHVFTQDKRLPDWNALKKAEKAGLSSQQMEARERAVRKAYEDTKHHVEKELNC